MTEGYIFFLCHYLLTSFCFPHYARGCRRRSSALAALVGSWLQAVRVPQAHFRARENSWLFTTRALPTRFIDGSTCGHQGVTGAAGAGSSGSSCWLLVFVYIALSSFLEKQGTDSSSLSALCLGRPLLVARWLPLSQSFQRAAGAGTREKSLCELEKVTLLRSQLMH